MVRPVIAIPTPATKFYNKTTPSNLFPTVLPVEDQASEHNDPMETSYSNLHNSPFQAYQAPDLAILPPLSVMRTRFKMGQSESFFDSVFKH